MDHMALSRADRVTDKEMAQRRVTVAMHHQPPHKTLIASLSRHRAMIIMDRNHLGMPASHLLMGSKVPIVLRHQQAQRVTDSKAPTAARGKQLAAMEDGA